MIQHKLFNSRSPLALLKGKRAALANALSTTGTFRLLRAMGTPAFPIFTFHRIQTGSVADQTPFLGNLYGASAEHFESSVRALMRLGTPVGEQQVLDFIAEGKPLPPNPFMITFDDGYRDAYDVAFPILKRLGVPAILFVSTHMVSDRQVFWWDLLAYYLRQYLTATTDTELSIGGQAHSPLPKDPSEIRTLIEAVVEGFKVEPGLDPFPVIHAFAKAHVLRPPSFEERNSLTINWDQAREMDAAGFRIASHSHTHRTLSHLSADEQLFELTESKRILEAELGREVKSFAYPVGGYDDFNSTTQELVRKAGYTVAYSYRTGVAPLDRTRIDPTNFVRTDEQATASLYEAVVSLPTIFGRAKSWRRTLLQLPLRHTALALACALLFSACSSAGKSDRASSLDPAAEFAKERRSLLKSHVIAPGYSVSIRHSADPAISGEYTVSHRGELQLPLNVQVVGAGLTVRELEGLLESRYASYFKIKNHIQVQITSREVEIEIRGLVRKPGLLTVKHDTPLEEVLSRLGGVPGWTSSVVAKDDRMAVGSARPEWIRLVRPVWNPKNANQTTGESVSWINLSDYFQKYDARNQTLWRGGETLFFQVGGDRLAARSRTNPKLQIIGEIKNPGEYPVQEGTDLLTYITQAGGTTTTSDLSNVTLVMKSRDDSEGFNLTSQSPAPEIHDGDTLIIGSIQSRPSFFERTGPFLISVGSLAVSVVMLLIAL